jgi:phosphatidylglycerol:prolipoprotein diacylglycerol transferase
LYPKLISIGPFALYSYGTMLVASFVVAAWLLGKELRRKGLAAEIGPDMTFLAVVFGVTGSKLAAVLEDWHDFTHAPKAFLLGGGLTWHGGLLLATAAIALYIRQRRLPFLRLADATAPGLMLAYGIARIGCHLSGDGDYGMPTSLPWGYVYSKGTVPPSVAFKDFPDIVSRYGVNGVVPDTIPVHPTPIYECIAAIILFAILWRLRTRPRPDGWLFSLYLVLSGIERFLVEFIRVEPRLWLGLTEAQWVFLILTGVGMVGLINLTSRAQSTKGPGGRRPP